MLLRAPYLGFVADHDVVLHGKGNVVHRELQEGALWDIDQTDTCPGGGTVVRVGPWDDSHSLQGWNENKRTAITPVWPKSDSEIPGNQKVRGHRLKGDLQVQTWRPRPRTCSDPDP